MKKAAFQRWRQMCCGDHYGFGLWLNDENANRYQLKNMPHEVAWDCYQRWLAEQPMCGHKKCAHRHEATRQPWTGNTSQVMWRAYQLSRWTPGI